jgi:hypothetical protein
MAGDVGEMSITVMRPKPDSERSEYQRCGVVVVEEGGAEGSEFEVGGRPFWLSRFPREAPSPPVPRASARARATTGRAQFQQRRSQIKTSDNPRARQATTTTYLALSRPLILSQLASMLLILMINVVMPMLDSIQSIYFAPSDNGTARSAVSVSALVALRDPLSCLIGLMYSRARRL